MAETTPQTVIPQATPLWLSYRYSEKGEPDAGYYGRVIAWSPAPDGYGWDPVVAEYGTGHVEAVPVREGGAVDALQLADDQAAARSRAASFAPDDE